MRFWDFIFVFSLLSLVQSQEDGGICTCSSVMVMSKEEMKREISSQVSAAVSREFSSDFHISNITSAMERTIDKLCKKVERLIQPIIEQPAIGKSPSHPANSCREILDFDSKSLSGLYWLKAGNGSAIRIFCDMTRTCGGVTGGWMKVAELDMTNTSNQCPHDLRQTIHNTKRLCTRNSDGGGCSPVNYKTHGIGYNEVCGKIIGYQYATVDALITGGPIDNNYVDGVSLTYGNPKRHIWTFAAALDEVGTYPRLTCHCTNRDHPGRLPPSFVGNDYFCDSGSRHRFEIKFYDDPLWDGKGCGPLSDCCTFNTPPWFYKKLPSGTSDNIEMRVCRSEAAAGEDVLIEKVDIFVR